MSVSIDVVRWVFKSGHYTCPPSYSRPVPEQMRLEILFENRNLDGGEMWGLSQFDCGILSFGSSVKVKNSFVQELSNILEFGYWPLFQILRPCGSVGRVGARPWIFIPLFMSSVSLLSVHGRSAPAARHAQEHLDTPTQRCFDEWIAYTCQRQEHDKAQVDCLWWGGAHQRSVAT